MENEIMNVEFTEPLNRFLAGNGYTHVLSLGADDSDCKTDTDDKVVYWLEPLKPQDDRIKEADCDYPVTPILDSEVFEMAEGQDNTVFMIKVPAEDLKLYESDK
ncbi:MAG: hypothetical protein JWR61_1094 [Ferruginibacter sp.]|uniref:hypothetical protein n=1 Tax=Ferruginibacter sp. TaxID=1940288 RepID=UPI00265B6C56|nr:hypothetical protein [Ferruginibacter sp.]MDB5276139.1 hypothetical protein [Ferruginibacter sp.]